MRVIHANSIYLNSIGVSIEAFTAFFLCGFVHTTLWKFLEQVLPNVYMAFVPSLEGR
jgi:hypothetical protein